jgi:hypothetical protein
MIPLSFFLLCVVFLYFKHDSNAARDCVQAIKKINMMKNFFIYIILLQYYISFIIVYKFCSSKEPVHHLARDCDICTMGCASSKPKQSVHVPVGGVQRYRPPKKKAATATPTQVPAQETKEGEENSSNVAEIDRKESMKSSIDEEDVICDTAEVEVTVVNDDESKDATNLIAPLNGETTADLVSNIDSTQQIVEKEDVALDIQNPVEHVDSAAAAEEAEEEVAAEPTHAQDDDAHGEDDNEEETEEEDDVVPAPVETIAPRSPVAALIAMNEKKYRRVSMAMQRKVLSTKSSSSRKVSEYEEGVNQTIVHDKRRIKMLRENTLKNLGIDLEEKKPREEGGVGEGEDDDDVPKPVATGLISQRVRRFSQTSEDMGAAGGIGEGDGKKEL